MLMSLTNNYPRSEAKSPYMVSIEFAHSLQQPRMQQVELAWCKLLHYSRSVHRWKRSKSGKCRIKQTRSRSLEEERSDETQAERSCCYTFFSYNFALFVIKFSHAWWRITPEPLVICIPFFHYHAHHFKLNTTSHHAWL